MSLAGKIFAVISMLAAVFYAGITAALVSLQENYKQKLVDANAAHALEIQKKDTLYADLESKHKQLNGEYARLQNEKSRLLGENRELSAEWAEAAALNKYSMALIEDQESQIESLNGRVDRYNDDLKLQRDDNKKLAATIEELKAKGADLLANRDKLQDLLTVKENDLTNAVKEVEKLTGDLSYANDKLAVLKDQYPEVYGEIIKGGEKIIAQKVIRGKVTGVDKGLGLVILNVGQRNEVRKGYVFIVFRGDQYIGRVVVDEVFPDMAAAHYDKPAMKSDVEVGDDATTKLTVEL